MLKILVVDDEPEIADSVAQLCRDSLAGVEVAVCYMGRQAADILRAEPVDLLISDISMPGTGGFDLLKLVKAEQPDCRVIFLTGYRDFDYVYEAIQNSDVSYIIKSETDEKIIGCVRGVLEEITARRERRDVFERAQSQLRELTPMVRKEYLSQVIAGGIAPGEVTQAALDQFFVPLCAGRPVVLVMGRFDHFDIEATAQDKYRQGYALKDIFEGVYPEEEGRVVFLGQDYTLLCVHQAGTAGNMRREADLRAVARACGERLGATVSFAFSARPFPIAELAEHHRRLLHTLCAGIGVADGMILYGREEEATGGSEAGADLSGQYQALAQALAFRDKAHFFRVYGEVSAVLAGFSSRGSSRAQEIYYSLSSLLLGFLNRSWPEDRQALLLGPGGLRRVEDHRDWAAAARYLAEIFAALFTEMAEEQDNLRGSIQAVRRYVQQHLASFSLASLAQALHFHPTYLSRMYKSVTGTKLLDYVHAQRLDYAKKKLRESGERINDIGAQIGYDTPQSFARFFKRQTGMTPQEYRHQGPA